jgi:hypothetical protein
MWSLTRVAPGAALTVPRSAIVPLELSTVTLSASSLAFRFIAFLIEC